ncbi:MAG: DUF4363 family protein [Clostridia bacterium]|nr:DUF4363 family protein [Clostridia bacterium]
MKRLIPAVIILVLTVSVCVFSHIYVNDICDQTLTSVENYYNKSISPHQIETTWEEQKEKMSLFVNHDFLDKISIYVGQLTINENIDNSPERDITYKNIKSVLKLIKEKQKFELHSFY